jgi:IS30 family transposase
LSEEERVRIGDLRQAGHSIRAVAADLGRSPSTISREIRRNRDADGKYRPFTAQRATAGRRARPRPGKLARDPVLAAFVQDRLRAAVESRTDQRRPARGVPRRPERHVVHETIYQALYVQGRGQLRRELVTKLRTGRARRKPHRRPGGRRQGCFVDPDVGVRR